MKTLFTITTLLLLSTQTSLVAQTSHTIDYLVLNVGDTLYGKVKHIDEGSVNPKYYKKIRFTDTHGKQKKYKRKDISQKRDMDRRHYQCFHFYPIYYMESNT